GDPVVIAIDYNTRLLQVRANVVLDLGGFVQINGGFAFSKSDSLDVTPAGQTTTTNVAVTTFGFDSVDAFVGAGPYFIDNKHPDPAHPLDPAAALAGADGIIDANDVPSPDAAGLLLHHVSMAFAYFKPTDTTDTHSYYAV